MEVRPRNEIPVEHTWNSTSVFATLDDLYAEQNALCSLIPSLQAYSGKLDTASVLGDALDLWQELSRRVAVLSAYYRMMSGTDFGNKDVQVVGTKKAQVSNLLETSSCFLKTEILDIGETKLKEWMEEEPRLRIYAHHFSEMLRLQSQTRSAEVETVLSLLSTPFSAVKRTSWELRNKDLKYRDARTQDGKEVKVYSSNVLSLIPNADRELRRTAWESYCDAYLSIKNGLADNYLAMVQQQCFWAKVRGCSSALEFSLSKDGISPDVVLNLVDRCQKNAGVWHRYWRIRKQFMGFTNATYDLTAPLQDKSPEVPFTTAVDWICEALKPLGEEYVNAVRKGCLEDRWVDIYPTKGKGVGIFSDGAKGTFPFISLNYHNSIKSASGLAHELGHSMHSYFTNAAQPQMYTHISDFLGETASNFNQTLLRNYLLETNSDPKFQLAVIEELMDCFHRYLFVMPTLTRWELEIYRRAEKREALYADNMCDMMAEYFAEGYGNETDFDKVREGITWAQFGQLYTPFYVFTYVTGIAGAYAAISCIQSGKENAVENYLKFLSLGSSVPSLEALNVAGIDLTSPEAIDNVFVYLNTILDRLEGMLEATQSI